MTEKITYRKVRDVGDVFATSFQFMKQNFKPMYGSLLLFSAPLLLAGTLIYTYFTGLAGFSSIFTQGIGYGLGTFFGIAAVAMSCVVVGLSVYTTTLNKTVIFNETLLPEQELTIGGVANRFFTDYWRLLGNMILFSIVLVFIIGFTFLLFGGLVFVTKELSTSGVFMGIVTVLMVLAFFLVVFPILSFVPIAALFVCQRDRIGIFSAIGKVFSYMKGNFWSTWVFSALALLTYSVMITMVQIPVFILTTISTYSRMNSAYMQNPGYQVSVTLIITTIVCSLIGYLVMSVFYLMNIYQFTSLEEKREGVQLIDSINAIN